MHIGHVTLDRKREIAYGTHALKTIEREIGRPLSDLGTSVGVTEVAALLYAGLSQLDRTITAESTETLLDDYLDGGGAIQPVADAITDALTKSGWFTNPTAGGK